VWRHVCLAAALGSAAGCSQILGIENFELGADAANNQDAPGFCYGTSLVRACLDAEPTGPVTQTTAINTDADCQLVRPQPAGPELCIIAGTTVNITGTANLVTGARPLVLIATDSISVAAAAVIDVSSRSTTRVGAGANEATCAAPTSGQNSVATSGAGGAGAGGFGTIGGDGGNGSVAKGIGGIAAAPTFLRGGCKGADGGDAGTVQGGAGGNAGGAIYFIAGNAITIDGSIFASAAGGRGGGIRAGGGGGGSGGMIGLDAPTITIGATGIVAANGGGGGGGGGSGGIGNAGGDGSTLSYTTAASAGGGGVDTNTTTPTRNGGNGGVGAAMNAAGALGGNSLSTGAGGGGGGGGVGVIWVKGTLTGTRFSPTPTMAP
jgi:hypothetical protein